MLGLLSSCTTLEFDVIKVDSTACPDTDETSLGVWANELGSGHTGESGFYVLSDGIEALAMRLLLAERAERCIDAQYYLITMDEVGLVFLDSLMRAADRGVRVRLLVDDIFTWGYDDQMATLDTHPNVDVRIFNPFVNREFRFLDVFTRFRRINRRMHNKSFTIDTQATVFGGRNIAAEYFAARRDFNFTDLDVLGVGPVVDEVSEMFDVYWNHRTAVPVTALTDMPEDPAEALDQMRERFARATNSLLPTPYAEALRGTTANYLNGDDAGFTWAPYEVVYDSPDKPRAEGAGSILGPLYQSVREAERELLILSPYFILTRGGVQGLGDLVRRGVEVRVVTNSLAANNQIVAHSGYSPSRRPLLEAGVELYELRPDARVSASQRAGDVSRATLHTKSFVVDRESLFVGSFNWDPRSAHLNTELGVLIHSPELAGMLLDGVDANLPGSTYRVTSAPSGGLRWTADENGEPVVFNRDPATTLVRRIASDLLSWLPIKGLL